MRMIKTICKKIIISSMKISIIYSNAREVGDIWKDELLAVKGSKAWGTDLAILSM